MVVRGVQVVGLDVERYPPAAGVWVMVANRILARPLASMRRNRRVSSYTLICPMPGRVTERGRLLSPTRIAGGRPLGCLLRSRNAAQCTGFLLEAREPDPLAFTLTRSASPTRRSALYPDPRRLPRTPADTPHAATPSPVTTVSTTPSMSTVKTRPASSVFFHALNALIRSNPSTALRHPARLCAR